MENTFFLYDLRWSEGNEIWSIPEKKRINTFSEIRVLAPLKKTDYGFFVKAKSIGVMSLIDKKPIWEKNFPGSFGSSGTLVDGQHCFVSLVDQSQLWIVDSEDGAVKQKMFSGIFRSNEFQMSENKDRWLIGIQTENSENKNKRAKHFLFSKIPESSTNERHRIFEISTGKFVFDVSHLGNAKISHDGRYVVGCFWDEKKDSGKLTCYDTHAKPSLGLSFGISLVIGILGWAFTLRNKF